MTKEELVEKLCGDFRYNFANIVAKEVVDENALHTLMEIHFGYKGLKLSKADKDKVAFRSSYVIEKIYFNNKLLILPYLARIVDNFENVDNGSMMRHYCKIVNDVIKRQLVDGDFSGVARGCLRWAVDEKIKVAVKVWAVDILIQLQGRVGEVREYVEEVIEVISKDPSPAILCRLKRWKEKLKELK